MTSSERYIFSDMFLECSSVQVMLVNVELWPTLIAILETEYSCLIIILY